MVEVFDGLREKKYVVVWSVILFTIYLCIFVAARAAQLCVAFFQGVLEDSAIQWIVERLMFGGWWSSSDSTGVTHMQIKSASESESALVLAYVQRMFWKFFRKALVCAPGGAVAASYALNRVVRGR